MQEEMNGYTQLDLFSTNFQIPESTSKPMEESVIYKKYGISKVGNLSKLDQDSHTDLWSLFHQISQFIYLNGEWTWSDCLEAAKFLYPYLGFITAVSDEMEFNVSPVKNVVSLSSKEIQDLGLLAGRYSTYDYAIKLVLEKYDGKRHYLVLTDDFSKLEQMGTTFIYSGSNYNFTYISKGLLIGFAKLIKDILNEADKANNINPRRLWELLESLCSGKRSVNYLRYQRYNNSTWINPDSLKLAMIYANKLGHKFSDLNDGPRAFQFVKSYLGKVYSQIFMQHREDNLVSICNTKSWNTQSSLNPAMLTYLYSSPLRQYFTQLQFDNNIATNELKSLEETLIDLMKILPKGKVLPVLRIKNIGHRSKNSLYLEAQNQIVIDMRRKYVDHEWRNGISTFVHQYGHYIDYQFTNKETPLSVQQSFSAVVRTVSDKLKNSKLDNKLVREHNLYAPTEIFAISFELYLFYLGIQTKAMLSERSYLKQSYFNVFNECKVEIIKYFDNLFPELKVKVNQSAQETA